MRRNERKYEMRDNKWVVIAGKEKHPDYNGKAKLKVAGGEIDVYLSAWVRKGQDGKPFMSYTLEYPQNEQRRLALAGGVVPTGNATIAGVATDEVEDLPF
jgi:hypothetical protein